MSPAEHALWDLWITTFAATKDGFVVDSNRTVTSHQLNPEMCAQADISGRSISGFLAAPWEGHGMHTTVGAIDVDTTFGDAVVLADFLRSHGVLPLMVRSRRGAHLWVWTAGDGSHGSERYMPVPAGKVRKALTAAVALAIDDPERRAHIEVFPKRSSSPYGVGALRMPLFRHPKDGTVYPVLDADMTETTDRLTAYGWTIPLDTPYAALCALGGMQTPPKAYPTALGRLRRATAIPEGPGVSAILAAMGVPNAHPGRTVRCPFHEDRHGSLSISTDDQRAWCKAPTCLAYNGGRGLGSLALGKVRQ